MNIFKILEDIQSKICCTAKAIECKFPVDVTIENDAAFGVNICEGGTVIFNSELDKDVEVQYQWQILVDDEWVNISGANSDTYSTTILFEGDYTYRVVITQPYGCEANSNTNTLQVVLDPLVFVSFDGGLDEVTVTEGTTVDIFSEVVAGVGGANYQWQIFNDDSEEWEDIPLANNSIYTKEFLLAGTFIYRLDLTQTGSGCETISNIVTITVEEL